MTTCTQWQIDERVPMASIGYRAIVTYDGETVCSPSPMGLENARLIAAAPDLLAALKVAESALDAYSGGESSDLETIRAAIARAEGNQA
jgi:hypothetical protein